MMSGGGVVIMWLFWLAIIVIVLYLAVYRLDPTRNGGSRSEEWSHPETFRRRSAKREIDSGRFQDHQDQHTGVKPA